MEFKVIIEETLRAELKVNASNEEEAISLIEDKYNDSEIVLDSENFIGKDIRILEAPKEKNLLHSLIEKYTNKNISADVIKDIFLELKNIDVEYIENMEFENKNMANFLSEQNFNNEEINQICNSGDTFIIKAIKNFKISNGRTWKSKLKDAWFNGSYNKYIIKNKDDITYLQQARNKGINLNSFNQ